MYSHELNIVHMSITQPMQCRSNSGGGNYILQKNILYPINTERINVE